MGRDWMPIAIYLVLTLILMRPYLGEGYFLALDMQWGPNNFADFQFQDFYGEEPNPYGAYLPYRFVFAALTGILSSEVLQKALIFMVFFISGVSAHYSLPEKLGRARYFAGLFYMLNPFVFIRFLAGHWPILLSYAFWPLALRLFHEFLERKDRPSFAKAALITFLASVSSHSVFMLLLSYLVLFVIHIVREEKRPRQLVKRTVALGLTVLAMNLFWILPTLLLFESKFSPASAEAYLEDFAPRDRTMSTEAALLTLHGFWRGGFAYLKDIFGLWWVPFLPVALLALYGAYMLLREDAVKGIFIVSVFALGFLFALGASSPISFVFDMFNLSLFFRDSQKFVGMLALCYSLAGAYGLHFLSRRFDKRYVHLLLVLPLLSNIGIFFYLGQVGLTQYPSDWVEADRIIANDSTPSNILVFSPHLYQTFDWVNAYQKTLAIPAGHFFSKPVLMPRNVETANIHSDVSDPYLRMIIHMFESRQYINDTAEFLLPMNARYVLIFKNDPDAIHYAFLFHRHGGLDDMELVYESEDIYLFRNGLAKGPFMASRENGSQGLLLDHAGYGYYSPDVEYERLGQSRYLVKDAPYGHVVFAEPYNQYWDYAEGRPFAWRTVAMAFPFSEGGILENRLHHLVSALFLLSWLMALLLLIRPGAYGALTLAAIFIALFALVFVGALGPANIGALISLSIVLSILWLKWPRKR